MKNHSKSINPNLHRFIWGSIVLIFLIVGIGFFLVFHELTGFIVDNTSGSSNVDISSLIIFYTFLGLAAMGITHFFIKD